MTDNNEPLGVGRHESEAAPQNGNSDPLAGGALTSRMGRNTLLNIVGLLAPSVVALITVPAYLSQIGEARYGILVIVWLLVGYFSVFDFGLGRATANRIAGLRGGSERERNGVFWTALIVNGCLGALGGMVLLLVGASLIGRFGAHTAGVQAEVEATLPWLAAAVPLTTINLILVGALEGCERFLALNVLAILGSVSSQLLPLMYAYVVGPSLTGLIPVTTAVLAANALIAFVVTSRALPATISPTFDRQELSFLFRYGGWVMITSFAGMLMASLDRLIIGAVSGARAVTRYTIPFTLVSRASIIPIALARTLFPRLSMLSEADAKLVARQVVRALIAVMTPIVVIGALLLEPFLRVWVGDSLAETSAPVGSILLVGLWVNSLAVVPFALLPAQGRPDLAAKIQLLELPLYAGMLFLGIHFAGIVGAALAWSTRAALDAVLLFWVARLRSDTSERIGRPLSLGAALVVAACVASLVPLSDPLVRLIIAGALVITSIAFAWRISPNRVRESVGSSIALIAALRPKARNAA